MVKDDCRRPEPPGQDGIIKFPVIGRFLRLAVWWLVFTGIYASSSVCPFCGRPGCPVGGVSAGVVGGVFALIMAKGKACLNYLARRLAVIRLKLRTKAKAYSAKN